MVSDRMTRSSLIHGSLVLFITIASTVAHLWQVKPIHLDTETGSMHMHMAHLGRGLAYFDSSATPNGTIFIPRPVQYIYATQPEMQLLAVSEKTFDDKIAYMNPVGTAGSQTETTVMHIK